MPTPIVREELLKLLQKGVQLVEVLGQREYRELHLPGAINLPLRHIDRESVGRLNRDQPVVVYCHDYQ